MVRIRWSLLSRQRKQQQKQQQQQADPDFQRHHRDEPAAPPNLPWTSSFQRALEQVPFLLLGVLFPAQQTVRKLEVARPEERPLVVPDVPSEEQQRSLISEQAPVGSDDDGSAGSNGEEAEQQVAGIDELELVTSDHGAAQHRRRLATFVSFASENDDSSGTRGRSSTLGDHGDRKEEGVRALRRSGLPRKGRDEGMTVGGAQATSVVGELDSGVGHEEQQQDGHASRGFYQLFGGGGGVGRSTGGTGRALGSTAASAAEGPSSLADENALEPVSQAASPPVYRVRFNKSDQENVKEFVAFFRTVFGITMVIDDEEGVVKLCERGYGNPVASCLEHALRVCREGQGQWKPSDFSLVQMRMATAAEDPSTSPLLLPIARGGGNTPKMPKLRVMSADHGILASTLTPVQLDREGRTSDAHNDTGSIRAPASEEQQRPRGGSPKYRAPPNVHATSALVTQLWGLEHSVEPAVHRAIAMTANREETSVVLGSRIVGELAKAKFKPTGPSFAKITFDKEDGTLNLTGPPAKCQVTIVQAADFLLKGLPHLVKSVDMIDVSAMRNLGSPRNLLALARREGVPDGEIRVLPLLQKMCVLVMANGAKPVERALDKMCDALSKQVQQWQESNVSLPLNPQGVFRALEMRVRDGNSFEARFVGVLAEALSHLAVDLWLDGSVLRGIVPGNAGKNAEEVLRRNIEGKFPTLVISTAATEAAAPRPTSAAAVATASSGSLSVPTAKEWTSRTSAAKKPSTAIRVRYDRRDQSTLDTFLGFFRSMCNATFEVDAEISVVSISGPSTTNTALDAAQCLQHALYVCREDGFQPCDFLLVRARNAAPGETADEIHLWSGDKRPSTSALSVTAHQHGIVVGEIVTEPTRFPAPAPAPAGGETGGEGDSGSGGGCGSGGASGRELTPGSPSYSVPEKPGPSGRFTVVQLWGLKHCVEPAFERILAIRSNQLVTSLTLGPNHAGTLTGLIPLQEVPKTRVEVDEGVGVLRASGAPSSVDALLGRIVDCLSCCLPASLISVDVSHVGAMRKLTSQSALRAIAQAGGVKEDLIILVPWWQQTRIVMIALVPGGDQAALQRMCDALRVEVQRWCEGNVDVVLSMPFITKAEDVIDRTGGDENGKDVRLKVVSSVSEALGIDLWLDGLHLRGRLTNASGQQDAQRALEAQVTKMAQVLKLSEDEGCVRTAGKEDAISKKEKTIDDVSTLAEESAVDAASKVDAPIVAPPLAEVVGGPASSVQTIDASPPRPSRPLSVPTVSGASRVGWHATPPPAQRGTDPSCATLRTATPLLPPNHPQRMPRKYRNNRHQQRRTQRQQQNPRQTLDRASAFPSGLVFRGGSGLNIGGGAVALQTAGHSMEHPNNSAQANATPFGHQYVSSSVRSSTVTTVGGIGAHQLAMEQQHMHHRHYHHYHHYSPVTHGNDAFHSGVVAGLMAATGVSPGSPAALGMYHNAHRQECVVQAEQTQGKPTNPPLHSGQEFVTERAANEGRAFEETAFDGGAVGK